MPQNCQSITVHCLSDAVQKLIANDMLSIVAATRAGDAIHHQLAIIKSYHMIYEL